MVRKHGQKGRPWQQDGVADRPFNPGSHWRADGAPKTPYRSQAEALSVADERRQDTGVDLQVYRCDHCSAWHMGSPGSRRR